MAKQNGKRDFSKFEEAIAKKEGGDRDFSKFEDALKKKVPTAGSVESQDLSQGVPGGSINGGIGWLHIRIGSFYIGITRKRDLT